MGAMILHGITPGPNLINEQPQMFWGLIMSFWVGNLLLLVLNIPLIGMWVKLLSVPYRMLYPCVLIFICLGVYSANNNVFDIFVVLGFGILGYLMRRTGFPATPVLLGFILGPLLEENFRRAMLLSRGDLGVFFTSPISAVFMGLSLLFLASVFLPGLRARLRGRGQPGRVSEPGETLSSGPRRFPARPGGR